MLVFTVVEGRYEYSPRENINLSTTVIPAGRENVPHSCLIRIIEMNIMKINRFV